MKESGIPTLNSLKLIEKSINKIKPDTQSHLQWYANYATGHRDRLACDVDYTLKYIDKGSKVIEFGSIPPILTLALSNLGYDVCGIDIGPERYRSAISSMGVTIKKVNIEKEKLPFNVNEFDGAICNQVFEHLRINLIETFNEIYRVIKPGGTLFLSTPNLTSLLGWFSLIFRNMAPGDLFDEYMKIEKLGHMGHIREYTSVEVCTFLEKIGFRVNEIIYRGYYQLKGPWKVKIAGLIVRVLYRLRPSFSVVAIKPTK